MNIKIVEPTFELMTPENWIGKDYLTLIELAARNCYRSEDRITKDSSAKMVKMLVKRGHESVLEHMSITGKFICSRAASHQLVRHRIAAYSQESSRYCDYSKDKFENKLKIIVPPSIRKDPIIFELFKNSASKSYSDYLNLVGLGILPEDARFLLPHCLKTEVVTTYNLRTWRHVFQERAFNKKAQWEIRDIMLKAFIDFYKIIPVVFEDLYEKYIMPPIII